MLPEDASIALEKVYNLGREERTKRGLAGRQWAQSEEAKMTAVAMSDNIAESIEETFENFKPRAKYEVIKDRPRQVKKVNHKLIGY